MEILISTGPWAFNLAIEARRESKMFRSAVGNCGTVNIRFSSTKFSLNARENLIQGRSRILKQSPARYQQVYPCCQPAPGPSASMSHQKKNGNLANPESPPAAARGSAGAPPAA